MDFGRTSLKLVVFLVCLFLISISTTSTCMAEGINFPTEKKRMRWALGSVFLAAGCMLWASWFLIQAKIGKSYPFQYSSTAILSFFGVIQSAILTLLTERSINMSMWVLKGKLEILSVTYACGRSVLVIVGMYVLLWGKSNDAKEIVVKQTPAAEESADVP